MATIDSTGITPNTLTDYVTLLENAFKTTFGNDFNVDPETPQGQLIGIIALSMSQADDAQVSSAQAVDIYKAYSNQIEGIAAALGIRKRHATNTVVTVNLTGVPATLIPAGSRAKSVNGDLYVLEANVQLSGGGTGTGTMQAVETGVLTVGVGELTQIVDVVAGWETVNNTIAGSTGAIAESDTLYRTRYFNELFKNAVTPLQSVIAAVQAIDTVNSVIGRENNTDGTITIQGKNLISHSIYIAVDGGAAADIGAAIRLKKTAGTGTNGSITVSNPPNADIKYDAMSPLDITIHVYITIDTDNSDFPGNGLALIKQNIYDFIQTYIMGKYIYKPDIYTPCNAVAGHHVNGIFLAVKGVGTDVDEIDTNLNQKISLATIDDIAVTIGIMP